jgi:hypothetical protein
VRVCVCTCVCVCCVRVCACLNARAVPCVHALRAAGQPCPPRRAEPTPGSQSRRRGVAGGAAVTASSALRRRC